MFIKLSTFKKMCSHAYKETGLSVGLTKKEVYIIQVTGGRLPYRKKICIQNIWQQSLN